MDTRVRMGFKPSAKGVVAIDVTSEAPTVEETAKLLKEGIAEFKKIVKEENFILGETSTKIASDNS